MRPPAAAQPSETPPASRTCKLDRRLWFVRTAKGGLNSVIILNDEMVRAWQLFSDADAWGWFDDRSFSKTLKRNGWP